MSHDATKNLNEVMRKYDRESNTRAWEGKPKIAVQAYLAAFAHSYQQVEVTSSSTFNKLFLHSE